MIKQNWILKETYENVNEIMPTFCEIKYMNQFITIYLETYSNRKRN